MTMTLTAETPQQLSRWLGMAAKELDVPAEVQTKARTRYDHLNAYLKRKHEEDYRSDASIYAQGSNLLGTAIKPVRTEDDFDVDLVFRRVIAKNSVTQQVLKEQVGDMLRSYITQCRREGVPVPTLAEGSRCWTLQYPDKFHMDVLPALPDDEAAQHNNRCLDDAIIITDQDRRHWHHSNPKGYNEWFREQMRIILTENRAQLDKAASVEVEAIPEERARTTLQRAVQLLKRHRDLRYEGNPEYKPISIIITTLAAQAYRNESDLYTAMVGIVSRMHEHIHCENGVWKVPNPVNPKEENFADKWNQDGGARRMAFRGWLGVLKQDLDNASATGGQGMHKTAAVLTEAFGGDVIRNSARRMADEDRVSREKGLIKMSAGTGGLGLASGQVVKGHTFHGD